MGEAEVIRLELKEEIVGKKGGYVPSLHGKGLDKATVEAESEEG